jgi:hypothetical protein
MRHEDMKKVYCRDCEHYKYWDVKCCHPNNIKAYGDYETPNTRRYRENPNVLNEHNDCPNYKRIWWKLWA